MSSDEQRDNREKYPNLVRFKPGQSGNPGGRPKGQSLTALLREVADYTELRDMPLKGGRTAALALVESMFIHAIEGNQAFAAMILDRLEGKAIDKAQTDSTTRIIVEHVDGGSNPITDTEAARGTAVDHPDDGPVQCGELRPEMGEDGTGPESADPDRP